MLPERVRRGSSDTKESQTKEVQGMFLRKSWKEKVTYLVEKRRSPGKEKECRTSEGDGGEAVLKTLR